jgi:hypothetical protein
MSSIKLEIFAASYEDDVKHTKNVIRNGKVFNLNEGD